MQHEGHPKPSAPWMCAPQVIGDCSDRRTCLEERPNMLTKSVSRQEFLDLLQTKNKLERYDLHSVDRYTRIYRSSDELHLIWDDDDFPATLMDGRNTTHAPDNLRPRGGIPRPNPLQKRWKRQNGRKNQNRAISLPLQKKSSMKRN